MRLSLRFIIPLFLALAGVAYALVPLVDQLTLKWFVRDLDIRATLVANTVQEPLQEILASGTRAKILRFFNKITQDERLYAIGFCETAVGQPVATTTYPAALDCRDLDAYRDPATHLLPSSQGPLHVTIKDLQAEGAAMGRLVLVHDMSFVAAPQRGNQAATCSTSSLASAAVVSLITVVIAQLSPGAAGCPACARCCAAKGCCGRCQKFNVPELQPIARDLRTPDPRARIGVPAARRQPDLPGRRTALRAILRGELRGEDIHRRLQPRALHPPARRRRRRGAASGQRPGHGAGADHARLLRHLDRPRQRLGRPRRGRRPRPRRGAAGASGLPDPPRLADRRRRRRATTTASPTRASGRCATSPTCGRPSARRTGSSTSRSTASSPGPWSSEAKTDNPIVLVQDYHFALLPRMIRERLPEATIITFWHIPWPNPEAFAICPWREELLDGLLGSSILGFHTQFHCNNFVDTVDRLLEARVDRETFTVSLRRQADRGAPLPDLHRVAARRGPASPSRWSSAVPTCGSATACRRTI